MGEWVKKNISELGKVVSGATPSTTKKEFWNGEIIWITPTDLSKTKTPFINQSERKITELGLGSCSTAMIPRLNLVMSSRAPIGYFAIVQDNFTTNQGCKSIIFEKKQSPLFHYYNFLFRVNKFKEKGEGTTFAEISKRVIEKLEFLIPESFEEQTKIAQILTKIDQSIEKTEQLIAKYERIKTGLMQDLLTRGIDENGAIRTEGVHEFKDSPLGRIPVEWEVDILRRWVNVKGGGAFQSKDFTNTGTQLLRIGNLFNNQLDLSRSPIFLPSDFLSNYPDFIIKKGEIIMSMTGTYGKRDYGFAILIDEGTYLMNQRLCKFIYDNNIIDNHFLLFVLRSEYYLDELFKGVTGSKQGNLKNSNILDIKIALPKIDEQVRIRKRILDIFKMIEKEKEQLNKFQKLKVALMQDLLTGKVRVNDIFKHN